MKAPENLNNSMVEFDYYTRKKETSYKVVFFGFICIWVIIVLLAVNRLRGEMHILHDSDIRITTQPVKNG